MNRVFTGVQGKAGIAGLMGQWELLGIDRSILQTRVLAMLAEKRNSSLWIIALISSIASVVSAITAIIAVITK